MEYIIRRYICWLHGHILKRFDTAQIRGGGMHCINCQTYYWDNGDKENFFLPEFTWRIL